MRIYRWPYPADPTLPHEGSSAAPGPSTSATRSWTGLDSPPPPSSLRSASSRGGAPAEVLPRDLPSSPLLCDLVQRLHVAARIRFKTIVPTYKAVIGTAPTHPLQALVRPPCPGTAKPSPKSSSLTWPHGAMVRVHHLLPQETQDPSVQSSPGPRLASFPLLPLPPPSSLPLKKTLTPLTFIFCA